MSRWQKRFKKYERHFLLVMVIILLATFSVGGAFSCAGQGLAPGEKDYGGQFLVTPAKQEELDHADFLAWLRRWSAFRHNVGTPSLEFIPAGYDVSRFLTDWESAWTHVMPVQAAREAGYACGEGYQLPVSIRKAVQDRMGGVTFNDATYDRFLRDYYGRSASDFQDTVREVAVKDAFLRPLIESPRYTIPYSSAYEEWKTLLRRVDLEYVALDGADFALIARQRETTRARIHEQADVLRKVSVTAKGLLEVKAALTTWKGRNEDRWPADLEEAGLANRRDAWDHALRMQAQGDDLALRSSGPDGEFDTSDDVTLETVAQLKTRDALRQVGDALARWRENVAAHPGALPEWPASLDAMREPLEVPAEAEEGAEPTTVKLLPPLAVPGEDGWDRTLVLEAGADGALPRLYSLGADGEAGTADDVYASIDEARVLVPLGGAFIPFLAEEEKDGWDHALRVDFVQPAVWRWEVRSAGPDGEFESDDDLTTGNRGELLAYFRGPELQSEFREPPKREFEALYVHLPLVPEDTFKELWARYPEFRPDEEQAFDWWRRHFEQNFYTAETPSDPEEGHGAELARRVAPDAPTVFVPDVEAFGKLPDDFVGDNPDRKAWVEKGWRPILIREFFFENLMNDALAKARASVRDVAAWETKKAAFDAGEGEDPGDRPEVVTLETLRDALVADLSAPAAEGPWIGLYRTVEPMERSEWEAISHFADYNFTNNTNSLVEDGQYMDIPLVLNDGNTRVAYQNLKAHPERQQTLEEVYDVVFQRFVKQKELDVAAEKLESLRAAYEAEVAKSAIPGVESEAEALAPEAWNTALEAWAKDLEVPYATGSTGLFTGARPPRAREPDEDMAAEEIQRIRQRDYARTTGYESVRPLATSEETELRVGTVGRTVLRDTATDGTNAVYLVRVREVAFPPEAAFSPRAYADFMTAEVLGGPKGGYGLGAARSTERVTGVENEGLQHFFLNFQWMRGKFGLSTKVTAEEMRPAGR